MTENNDYHKLAIQSTNPHILEGFSGDKFEIFLYRKAEKICTAIYLVSNLFPENEPLRWGIRNLGLKMIDNCLAFIGQNSPADFAKRESLVGLRSVVLEVVSKLQVAFSAGLVSEMNFLIFKRELESFLANIRSRIGRDSNPVLALEEDFFKVTSESSQVSESASVGSTTSQARVESKGQNILKDTRPVVKRTLTKVSGLENYKGHELPTKIRHSDRQEKITAFLKRVSDASVKDFVDLIKGCSEKTIQRELLGLVGRGVLKKTGDRRWSRYSLV